MAELILSRAGSALGAHTAGGVFRTIGAALGRAAGARVGALIDRRLFGGEKRTIGPRLTDLHIQGSSEGASIPAIYGRVRIAGDVIWAARFKEHADTRKVSGGKGAPSSKVTTFSYSLSFAVGLCEGEVARISRAWANGREFDLSTVEWRLHTGSEDQAPDALIEAIEGVDNTPAYRGLAYIVFEDLPLDQFGNITPQFSFEISRTPPGGADRLEDNLSGVCLIPGSGEFVYATDVVRRVIAAGRETPENMSAAQDKANLLVSLDQLQADLPAVRSVTLVVAWFGTDLRCGTCQIRPGVEIADKSTRPQVWSAGGVDRAGAHLVSQVAGAPAFGGTPSDQSVVQAIAALKARGFSVCLYPFVLMDVPAGNGLPDPYGGAEQGAYPWRGRITCHPAAGQSGSPDKTAAAATQVASFFGAAAASNFSVSGTSVSYTGPAEWSFRRFILHYAKLAQAAGGVDSFIIGSELRGLTRVRNGAASYPAVTKLQTLAADVRAVLGATKLTYAADWSEYFGHQPTDGSGDVFYHLDPLWASSAIDAVGVDWYPPLTDWRDGAEHADAALASSIHDPAYLRGRIEAGEDYDFYYAGDADRAAQVRAPITDGAYAKPWVFRAKDIRSWWANAHHDRPGGVESAAPTAWIAQSKPIWFVELGCPAIDKGSNAPNLFVDPKSAESAIPPFSNGNPDDLIQRRTLEVYLDYWAESGPNNPVSSIYHGPMIAMSHTHAWAWDARPFPYYPARTDLWTDGSAWRLGHWLNGRAGAALLADVVRELAARAGDDDADVDLLSGVVPGYVADAPSSARALIEPLMDTFGFEARMHAGRLTFTSSIADPPLAIDLDAVAQTEKGRLELIRADSAEAPSEARLRFIDPTSDYHVAVVSARHRDAPQAGVATFDAPLCLDVAVAEDAAQRLLAEALADVETARVSLPPSLLALEPGDRVLLNEPGAEGIFRVLTIEGVQATLARDPAPRAALTYAPTPAAPTSAAALSAPDLFVLDLPPLPNAEDDDRPLAAVYAAPWPGSMDVLAGSSTDLLSLRALADRAAVLGRLTADFWPGPLWRWDDGNMLYANLSPGALDSVSAAALLDGANLFAVENAAGAWEIVQTRTAILIGPSQYAFSGLLRGQQGTEAAMGAPAGARIALLDQRLVRLDMRPNESGAAVLFAAVATSRLSSDPSATLAEATWRPTWGLPFSPVHINGARGAGGDITVNWVRRTRIGGDVWDYGDVALGEDGESYLVEIVSAGTVIRSWTASTPAATYSAAAQTADFGAPPSTLTVRIAQISARFGVGTRRESTIPV